MANTTAPNSFLPRYEQVPSNATPKEPSDALRRHNGQILRQRLLALSLTMSLLLTTVLSCFFFRSFSFTTASVGNTTTNNSPINTTTRPDRPILRFRPNNNNNNNNGTFKILQLTDLHLGEAENLDWGPNDDRKTYHVLSRLIQLESPDLIVLSGDQLTANNVDDNATAYYQQLGSFLNGYKVPYAMIFGNHDDADLEVAVDNGIDSNSHDNNETIHRFPAKTKRPTLVQTDQQQPYSLTEAGPNDIFGVSNYILNVYPTRGVGRTDTTPRNDSLPLVQIVLLDSGGGSLQQDIQQSQLEWVRSVRKTNVTGVVFQHIPTTQFGFHHDRCSGFQGEGVASLHRDDGLLDSLDPMVSFVAVGHDHGNSYCCRYGYNHTDDEYRNDNDRDDTNQVHLCFGRHSGYGGYGSWERGGRVYLLEQHESDDVEEIRDTIQWRSWVRLESGEVIDEYRPT